MEEYKVSVRVGEYTNRQGETKGKYLEIGEIRIGEKGPYFIWKSHCIPMEIQYLANKERKPDILCSMWAIEQDGNKAPRTPRTATDDIF